MAERPGNQALADGLADDGKAGQHQPAMRGIRHHIVFGQQGGGQQPQRRAGTCPEHDLRQAHACARRLHPAQIAGVADRAESGEHQAQPVADRERAVAAQHQQHHATQCHAEADQEARREPLLEKRKAGKRHPDRRCVAEQGRDADPDQLQRPVPDDEIEGEKERRHMDACPAAPADARQPPVGTPAGRHP